MYFKSTPFRIVVQVHLISYYFVFQFVYLIVLLLEHAYSCLHQCEVQQP
jgi:hypothetical protein